MPLLSSKRQVTLPKDLCDRLGLAIGNDLNILEHEGRITILKRTKGASKGVLSHVKINRDVTEAESRDDAMTKAGRGARSKTGKRRATA
jgi:bifunctional DNA-binding transcriptional regulator/antitoxin component of YhaV-PrlF toxin-antitoxin module